MTVAIVVAHWKVGFFIFKPNQGWEYCASIAVTAFVDRNDRTWSVVGRSRAGHRVARMDRRDHRRRCRRRRSVATTCGLLPPEGTHDRDTARTAPAAKPRRWVQAVLVLICALIAAMWVYAFIFAPKQGVYFVTEKAWRTSAEQICTAAERQRQSLADTEQGYISDPTNEQMMQRADIVDSATDIIEGMLDDVAALPLTPRTTASVWPSS